MVKKQNFVIWIKAKDIYKHITEDVETKIWYFKSWIRRPLPKGKNKKVIGLMKDELDGQIIQEFVGLRAKI